MDRPEDEDDAVLRRVEPYGPGITRRRHGRGHTYRDDRGRPVGPHVLRRIDELVIPPAWREVWVCADPSGHIQAVGTDDAGRRQYIYHPAWLRERNAEKHDRVLELSERLPRFRARLTRDLCGRGATRRRVLAAALRIIDRGALRPGGEEYTEDNGSFGLATMLRSHVRLRGDRLVFSFPGKSGKEGRAVVEDPALPPVVRAMRRSPGERFLAYRDATGWCDVHAEDINDRFKELTGDAYTVKDLRTWHATATAARAFAEPGATEAGVMCLVADELGNTPAVARDAYVDPRVVRAWEAGLTVGRRAGDAEIRGLIRLAGRPEETT